MNTPAPRTDDLRRARRAFIVVGLVAPLVVASIALVLVIAWLPDLPDQVVTHWGPTGPDGHGSPVVYVWMQVIVGFGMSLLLTLPVLGIMRESWGITCRLVAAVSLGVAVLVAVGMAGSVAIQRGGDGAGIGPVMAIGIGGALASGVIGWFLQPNVTITPDAGRAVPLHLAPGERAVWFGTAALGRPGIVGLAVAVIVLVGTTIWMLVLGSATWWVMALTTLLVIALIAATLVFRVRAGADGLRVRSIAGWPRWSIPTSDISDVQVVPVNPMADFGGWGLRISVDGRTGIVLRTGDGLQVSRRNGRPFVITIDDAATAASVLSAATRGAKS